MYYTNDDIDVDVEQLQALAWAAILLVPAIVIVVCWLAPLIFALG